MPLARGLTRHLRGDGPVPTRTFSTREGKSIGMDKISSPTELLSSTNVLSYEAPDVQTAKQNWRYSRFECQNSRPAPSSPPGLSPSTSTRTSSDNSPSSSLASSPGNSPASNATGITSPDLSPAVELNHLSNYFPNHGPGAVKRSASAQQLRPTRPERPPPIQEIQEEMPAAVPEHTAPLIPKRAPSHSKREHEQLARKRSMSRSRPTERTKSPALERDSFAIIGNMGNAFAQQVPKPLEVRAQSPFSAELEQLNEVAQDFESVFPGPHDEDLNHMRKHGLAAFCASDYLSLVSSNPFGFVDLQPRCF